MVDVVWLQPDNQHDQYQFELLLDNTIWDIPGSYEYKWHEELETAEGRGVVLVIPSKYWFDKVEQINRDVERFNWVLFILTGNEEAEFDPSLLTHPKKKIYYTTPHPTKTPEGVVDRYFGDGFAPWSEAIKLFTKAVLLKPTDVFFGGQVTHKRREQAVEALEQIKDLKVETLKTKGFAQGILPQDYYRKMALSKITPCPSGPATPDTFRTYEALQAMSIPIVDNRTPNDPAATDYWYTVLGELPFPVISDNWESLNGYSHDLLADWPNNVNHITAWWLAKKRSWAYNLRDDIAELDRWIGTKTSTKDLITVIIPCSPIPSHPSTDILDETISTIRTHLPNCEIIITFDGVRPEQEARRKDYEEFIYRVLWKCLSDPKYKSTLPLIFNQHSHQVKMARAALEYVKTPTLLYVEADCPITPDREIPFMQMVSAIITGEANVIRLHHEALILPDHEYLMLDSQQQDVMDIKMKRTQQWSQRPHLASVAYYRHMLDTYFTPDANSFIEDKMYGVLTQAVATDATMGWYNHRVWIYTPDGDIKRSYTTDGRQGTEKYDNTQVF